MAEKKAKKTGKKEKEEKVEALPVKRPSEIRRRESLWDPFGISREMDRIFGDFRRSFDDLFSWPALRFPEMGRMMPRFSDFDFELQDKPKEFILKAEAPGVDKKDVKIDLTPDDIEICVEVESKKEGEHRHSRYCRYTTFSEEVLPDKAKASLNKGLLEVRLPKKRPGQEPKKHRIEIQ